MYKQVQKYFYKIKSRDYIIFLLINQYKSNDYSRRPSHPLDPIFSHACAKYIQTPQKSESNLQKFTR